MHGNVAALQGAIAETNVVFVFRRSAGQWIHTQTLPGTQPRGGANPVALGRDYLAIGEIEAGGFAGAVHIYNEIGPEPCPRLRLVDGCLGPGWLTGYEVIAVGEAVLSGAPGTGTVFTRFGGVWSEEAQLPGSPYAPTFGFSGNRVFNLAGGAASELPNKPQGFVRHDGMWLFHQELTHPLNPSAQLDLAIAMDGRRLIVGDRDSESAFLFDLRDGRWQATAELKRAKDSACVSQFGFVATFELEGSLAIGACADRPTPDPIFDGRVLIYELPPLR